MAEPILLAAWVFFGAWICMVFSLAYTAFVNPRWFIEDKRFILWKPWRWLGLSFVISNQRKFEQRMRLLGGFYVVTGLLALIMMLLVARHG